MKTKCKKCGCKIFIYRDAEKICDDCCQYREDEEEYKRQVVSEFYRNIEKFKSKGLTEKEAIYKASLLV